jgi:ATP-dependent RNA helicase SUPV3L1/SUV3
MLGDISRGYAFTKAFLGLAAKELHLCGDASANHLIEEICDIIGDQVHLNQYERLSGPLEFQDPIKSLVDVEK